ncbi:MAG: PTS sugar transporter subunit IIA [Oscillospiraceae bacterium]|nr:PTS sugar transporter subunit IIA [Oscillospiraceae bacterium]
MIGLVVTGHGHFADGLHTSARMIAGESEYIKYVNFEDGMSTETLAELLSAAYVELKDCDGIVVLSDLPGGSPFKTAVECKYAHPELNIEVLAGTNLPMIVTAATMIEFEEDPKALADELIQTGTECIVRFELAVREDEPEDEEDDGI